MLPKNRSLSNLREQPLRPAHGGWYFVTFDPALTDSEPEKHQLIAWDVRLATGFLKTGSLEPGVGSYRWAGGFSELISAINCTYAKTGKPVEVSMDTEPMGTPCPRSRLCCAPPRTHRRALWPAIGHALNAFTPAECDHYVAQAGYLPSNREML